MMLILGLLLATSCASGPRPVANIPAIRHQIDDAIAADTAQARRTTDFAYEAASGTQVGDPVERLPSSRKITAMGRVRSDRAVVYTRPGAVKLEETWVREPEGWKLAHVRELDDAPRSTASR